MRFGRVVVIGSGKIACDCAKILCDLVDKEKIFMLESGNNGMSILSSWSEKEGINYYVSDSSKEIEQQLKQILFTYHTLIISANNFYLFPKDIVAHRNVEIINFHYSLLPQYRGINIPTWVIYNGERQTGITWHFIDEKIDHGRVIDQRIIPIYEDTTALEIVKQGMKLGVESFETFIDQILYKNITGKKVKQFEEKIYKKNELPNNGYLDVGGEITQIIRTLRAYDYGRTEIIPHLKLEWDNVVYTISRYIITKEEKVQERRGFCTGTKCVIADCGFKIEMQISRDSFEEK